MSEIDVDPYQLALAPKREWRNFAIGGNVELTADHDLVERQPLTIVLAASPAFAFVIPLLPIPYELTAKRKEQGFLQVVGLLDEGIIYS